MPAKLKIEFEIENEAFGDGNVTAESKRILTQLLATLGDTVGVGDMWFHLDEVTLYDINGNAVGRAWVEED